MTGTRKRGARRRAAGMGKAKWLTIAAVMAGLSTGGFAMQQRPGQPGGSMVSPQTGVLLFDFNSTQVSAANRSALQRHVQYLRGHPELAVVVEGYTHERGPVADDLRLGLDRALAVSRVLEQAGIDRDRIQVVSYEVQAVGAATASPGQARARRVALRYIPAAQSGAADVAQLGVTSPLLGIPIQ